MFPRRNSPLREDALLRHGAEDPDEREAQRVALPLPPDVLLLPVDRLLDDGQQLLSHVPAADCLSCFHRRIFLWGGGSIFVKAANKMLKDNH